MLRTSLALALPLLVVAVAQAGGCGSGSSTDACDAYFDGYIHCTPLPDAPDAVGHFRDRFNQLCAHAMALPGTSFTADQVSACGEALKESTCNGPTTPPACEVKPGSLADGAECSTSQQCKSAVCVITFTPSGDGGTSSTPCGKCTPAIAAGQPCGSPGMTACAQGTACDGSGGSQTCTPITYGAAGASCGTSSKRCNGDLFCDFSAMTCAAKKASGASCTSGGQCASGLTCDTTSMTCAKATFVAAGQPCSGTTMCEIGSCTAAGKCPTIIADGQACDPQSDTAICDLFAECEQGVCQPFLSPTCK